jgi:hypothetical protein
MLIVLTEQKKNERKPRFSFVLEIFLIPFHPVAIIGKEFICHTESRKGGNADVEQF